MSNHPSMRSFSSNDLNRLGNRIDRFHSLKINLFINNDSQHR